MSTQALLLPVLNGLARVFACTRGSTWLTTSIACYGDLHIVLLVCGSTLLAMFWVFAFVGEWGGSAWAAC